MEKSKGKFRLAGKKRFGPEEKSYWGFYSYGMQSKF